ncbi:hypothetical protein JOQ06_012911, partial [Pogonophryne albipinna]
DNFSGGCAIVKEFTRLMSMDLISLYEGLDSHLQKFLQLFRSKRLEGIKEMTSLMESLDKDTSNQRKRAAVLQGLPWYMRENPSTIMKMCEPTDPEEDVIKVMVIGVLSVVEDVKEPLPASYNDVALVIEERIVIRHLGDVPNAFVNLMGLQYMLNLDYPKDLKYTFDVIQRLFMGIGLDSCTPRVHSLKNILLTLADAEPETFFWELIELDGTTADDITKALMECLGRDFNEDFLELAVGDVVKEVSGLNHFQIFFDKLYSLFHASPKNQRQLAQCAQAVGQRLLVIGRVLSIRWVASSERSVRAVWENYRVLHDHFTNAANDTSRDSRDRAKYKGLDDVLTSATFVSNLGLMYDALTELSDLSRQLQKREMTLPTADRLLTREIRVFESMVTMPGPHMTTVHTALAEKSFKGVALRENGRLVQIHAGQFFRSMVENLRHRMTSTTSSHVSTREIPLHGREARDNQLIQDMKVIHPGSWPEEELDVQYGDVEVLRLCEVLKVDRRETVQGFREYKETRASRCTPAGLSSAPRSCTPSSWPRAGLYGEWVSQHCEVAPRCSSSPATSSSTTTTTPGRATTTTTPTPSANTPPSASTPGGATAGGSTPPA